jgi:pimeloyl-ACP methyl ester carboxylesterase
MTAVSAIGAPDAATIRRDIEVDVSHLVPFPGPVIVRGWVRAPLGLDRSRPPLVLCCLAGGHCSTEYFDLQVPGHPGYSMAEHLAGRGFVVLSFDHIGLGASSRVDDIVRVTPALASAVNDHAHRTALEGLVAGTLLPELGKLLSPTVVGVGHSMGGMLVTVQQARHATFAGVAALGHGGKGLPQFLTEAERAMADRPPIRDEDVVELARVRLAGAPLVGTSRPESGTFMAHDVPRAVRAAFAAQSTELLFSCGLTSMLPHATEKEKSDITVPVFLGFGENDLTRDFIGSVALYTSSRDVTLFVLPGSAHCHNQATGRVVLWDRLAHWAYGL